MSPGEQISLKNHFLEPETRCGYLVSAHKKALWKVQLDMLEQLLSVCQKHNLTISLAAGSLLGAIRHKGFIPWDDDFDVMMPREDFDKLMEIGPVEFRPPYFFQSPKTDPGYAHAIAKLRNSQTTAIVPRYAQEGRMCNMGIFIDIYPLDFVPMSDTAVKRKIKLMSCFHKLRANAYRTCHGKSSFRRWLLHAFSKALHFVVGSGRMYDLQTMVYLSGISKEGSRGIGMAPAIMNQDLLRRFTYPIDVLKHGCIYVPFEYMKVPVFRDYLQMLTITYGDWQKFVKGASGHQELIIDVDKPYFEVLQEKYGYTNVDINKITSRR